MENNFRLGMTAVEVISVIARINPQIKGLKFYIYWPYQNTKETGANDIESLLRHDYPEDSIEIKREDVTVENLKKKIDLLEPGYVLSFLSEVALKKASPLVYHVPMMDFSCPESPENLLKIGEFMRAASVFEGVILSSGRSYHFYGSRLMSKETWLDFLGDCGLSGLADPRYIFHGIKDLCCILRISTTQLRPKVPTVVAIL